MAQPKSVKEIVDQAGTMLQALSWSKRGLLALGVVLVAATIWIFVGLLEKPKYAVLYSGLKPAEAQDLGGRLAEKSIPYQLSADGGSVTVPSDRLDAARLQTASQGLPRNARLGFELFDTPNWAGSDFTEKVNYQRALEGELERTLQTLSEVEAVRVHLVLPQESLYSEQEREAKAAVIIKTKGGRLSEQAQRAIPQLVASAVDRLRPENVTVVDADNNSPLIGPHNPGEAGVSFELDEELAKRLRLTLEPVLGAEHVRTSVHVEYDTSTSENTEEVYDPKTVATLTQQKSEENAGGTGPAGVPGTASNLPGGAPATKVGQSDTQSSRTESETYAVSKSMRRTTQPPGKVRRVTAAVLIDDATDLVDKGGLKTPVRRKRTPDEMKEIEKLAGAAIGLDSQRGDMLAVQNLSFETLPGEKILPPTKLDVTRKMVTQWSGMLRYLGVFALFLIVYFLILRPVKKQILTAFRELPGKLTGARPSGNLDTGSTAAEIALSSGPEQAKRAATLKRQLSDKVKSEPEAASRLVQTLMRDAEKAS